MDQPNTEPAAAVESDITLPDDPRVLTILSTEHWSLLSARSLAYNEAFTRASMYLTFISLSFVGLALLAQGTGFTQEMLVIVAIVLGFDLLVGALTFLRIAGANTEDMRAMQGMNRIRHGYVRIVPEVAPFFVVGIHDDVPGIYRSYFVREGGVVADVLYGFSTSLGLVGLIVALVFAVFVTVIGLVAGLAVLPAIVIGVALAAVALALTARWAVRAVGEEQARLESLFPTPVDRTSPTPPDASGGTR
jgi:hypothetical protein